MRKARLTCLTMCMTHGLSLTFCRSEQPICGHVYNFMSVECLVYFKNGIFSQSKATVKYTTIERIAQ